MSLPGSLLEQCGARAQQLEEQARKLEEEAASTVEAISGQAGKLRKDISASPYVIQLICLTLSKPSPMTPMLQKLPVSVHSIFTFKEVITYALALERGGDEALLQVIAKVEVALFVVAAAKLFNDPRDKTRGPSP